jgi:hypothetical protein
MTEEALLIELRSINDRLTGLQSTLAVQCPDHSRRLLRLEDGMDGTATNGNNPGVKTRLKVVEEALELIGSEYAKTSALFRRVVWAVTIGPTGVLTLLGVLVYFLVGR